MATSTVVAPLQWRATTLLLLLASLAAACGGNEPSGTRSDAQTRPNVLLVTLDSARQDAMSCYGRRSLHAPELIISPNLDALAAEGAIFTRAYAPSSWTLVSHVGLMTGQPSIVHGVDIDSFAIQESRVTLAETFRESGYQTAGFFTGPYLEPRYGFAQGFDTYEPAYGRALTAAARAEAATRSAMESAQRRGDGRALQGLMQSYGKQLRELEVASHSDVSSKIVTDAVLAEIESARQAGKPWFIFAHYFDTHHDYVPPAPHDKRFDPAYDGDLVADDLVENEAISVSDPRPGDPDRRSRRISDRDLEHVRALLDGEMSWTDEQLGRVFDALRSIGELDNTIVIVTSDHGEEFFEHGNIGHRKTLEEEVVSVPLVLRYPARVAAGARVDGVVSLVDLYATILELADVAPLEPLNSRSAVALLSGTEESTQRDCFGRLVRVKPTAGPAGSKLQSVIIDETYLRWPIKIRRRRSWSDLAPGPNQVDKAQRSSLESAARRGRSTDSRLAWLDLESEAPKWTSDWEDPRARTALEHFVARYDALQAERSGVSLAIQDAGQSARLEGLGYTDAGSADAGEDRLKLSAPVMPW